MFDTLCFLFHLIISADPLFGGDDEDDLFGAPVKKQEVVKPEPVKKQEVEKTEPVKVADVKGKPVKEERARYLTQLRFYDFTICKNATHLLCCECVLLFDFSVTSQVLIRHAFLSIS